MLLRIEPQDPRWLSLAASASGASAFHHPAWAQTIGRAYGYEAFLLAEAKQDGTLAAGVPIVDVTNKLRGRRWISLPYTDVCFPLLQGDRSVDGLAKALEAQRAEAEVGYLEVRAYLPGLRVEPWLAGLIHMLPLTTELESVQKGFRPNVVRQIAQARKKGVAIRRAETSEDLTSTYYALHVATRRHQGIPAQPLRFFRLLWEEVLARELGFCLLAYDGSRPIAGAVFLEWQRTLTYKYGASDRSALASRPNNLLMWAAIEHAVAERLELFDFGRTDIANAGLRAFKLSWGCREEPLLYSIVGGRRDGLAARTLNSTVGAAIRHGPPGLCKLLGNAFYRYAA
jgi:CelD/BcsL family acetyltransferase involved in cellulose biosynthesis